MSATTSRIILVIILLLIGGTLWYLTPTSMRGIGAGGDDISVMPQEEKEGRYPKAKEITNPSGFINIEPFQIADYIGKKVILVDFWTYSCINCQRTLPYITAWDEKYRDQGLLIVGVHTPEFEFEKMKENVERAAEEFGIEYPIVQDNDYGTWTAYGNRYWPRKYIIDIDGYIVYDHIGEGSYAETERVIQDLLAERMERLGEEGEIASDIATPEAEVATGGRPLTPEIYFGAFRNSSHLGNGAGGTIGAQTFSAPETLRGNRVYLDGDWIVGEEYAENIETDGRILLDFQAKNVYFVGNADTPVDVEIYMDGELQKTISVQEERLYRILDLAEWGEHSLEMRIQSPGLEAFTFTFG